MTPTAWPDSGRFDHWWPKAKGDFVNARATSFYCYQLPVFTDLYGVDFETLTHDQARDLNRRIFENYQSDAWIHEVVTRRANIELTPQRSLLGSPEPDQRLFLRGAGSQCDPSARRFIPLSIPGTLTRRFDMPVKSACRSPTWRSVWR